MRNDDDTDSTSTLPSEQVSENKIDPKIHKNLPI